MSCSWQSSEYLGLYRHAARYKRRETGIRVIPIFRDRCITTTGFCFVLLFSSRADYHFPLPSVSRFRSYWPCRLPDLLRHSFLSAPVLCSHFYLSSFSALLFFLVLLFFYFFLYAVDFNLGSFSPFRTSRCFHFRSSNISVAPLFSRVCHSVSPSA